MRPEPVTPKIRARSRALARAWLLAGAALLVVGPAIAAAADPEPTPAPTSSASATVSPDATPVPTPDPTPVAVPTADPTQDPTPTPDPTSDPTPTPAPTPAPTPIATPRIESVLVYRRSAIVRQYKSYWCVPAAIQTMRNLILGLSNTTYAQQSTLYRQTRLHNRYRYSTLGNDVEGWAWSLRRWAYKPYAAHAYLSKTTAMLSIVEAIDRTRHPVGVAVRSGTHAWVVLGYKASVDPNDPTKRTLLGFYVTGPLGSPSDPYPYRYLSVEAFRSAYTRYHEWQRKVIWEGLYVVVND